MKRTESTEIDASPKTVWRVLTDFDEYDAWNPALSVEGRPKQGSKLSVRLDPKGVSPMRFPAKVTAVKPNRRIHWRARSPIPGAYAVDHEFRLKPLSAGRTRLEQTANVRGAATAMLPKRDALDDALRGMNDALKQRAESQSKST
ncbi:SRPBCC domain-containing protein [Haloprofundus salinisoli]|uniref:SRPBCC domain-containing protein n=1 Tax=Haloprofundus salinisoli TaxID=2876193 RepID=UPI001CCB0E35|nr:SRPBCC domain-containing protein [Haloprofundus salinisoli]